MKIRLLLIVLALLPSLWPAPTCADDGARFDFALIGDMQYDDQQVTNFFPNLTADINAADLAFVVHDGDIKSGSTPCADELLVARLADFNRFRHPFIYVPGDNEWRDCGSVKTNKFEPEERLARLHELFMPGEDSLGLRRLKLKRQSDDKNFASFRENIRWLHGGVVFAGMNVPGNDNFFGSKEFEARNGANLAWLREAFEVAKQTNAVGVMLIIQANPHFDLASTNRLRQGFNEMLRVLEEETLAFVKPVVLVHGDSHYFRIDMPLMGSKTGHRLENFTRVETFGNPDVHWLRVSVDPADPNVFTFRPQIVRKNVVNGRR